MEEIRNAYKILDVKPERKDLAQLGVAATSILRHITQINMA
jgi:hypothetical protein